MKYTYDSLSKKTVAQLREIAAKMNDEALQGYTTMHKEQLLPALCQALGIEAHSHHRVVGIDKLAIKAEIRQLKMQRDHALITRDHQLLKKVRRQIHGLKRQIRRATR